MLVARMVSTEQGGGIAGERVNRRSSANTVTHIGTIPLVALVLKSAHQRKLSRICCAEIEVDGLGSYPDIPGGRPHGSDSRCRSAFGREPCDRGAATHRPRAGIENPVGRTAYDGLRPDKRWRGPRCRSGAG